MIASSSGSYIERSTPWAIAHYLKSWSTGFGVAEVVAMLEKEKRAGVIFADAQWGNPSTALLVYGKQAYRTSKSRRSRETSSIPRRRGRPARPLEKRHTFASRSSPVTRAADAPHGRKMCSAKCAITVSK